MQHYDLNIKNILEQWNISDAIREIIANAIDESYLSQTRFPIIVKDNTKWFIKDFGRGISIANFSQNENKEKLKAKNTIGKFGIGLKDAIAVLFRNNIKFYIETKSFKATPILKTKSGFSEETIHMQIEYQTQDLKGTSFIFENVLDEDIQIAKENFLAFLKPEILFNNNYGQIIKSQGNSRIFINGMKVSIDNEYIFSYNITKLNKKLSSRMNRERRSIGRDAYSEIIEKIICPEMPIEIANILLDNEDKAGELAKKKVRKIVYSILNDKGDYVFMTIDEIRALSPNEKEVIESLGKKIKIIKNIDGDLLKNLYSTSNAINEYNENFNYEEIPEGILIALEKANLKKIRKIINELDHKKVIVIVKKNNILVSDTNGFWHWEEPNKLFIVRNVLRRKKELLMTAIHEYAHSLKGASDSTRDFENDLGQAWYKYSKLKVDY